MNLETSPFPNDADSNCFEAGECKVALQNSEHHYATLAEIAPVGIFRMNGAGECVYVNDRWCKFTGLSAAEAMGTGWAKALHPDDRVQVLAEWHRAVQTKQPFSAEYRFLKPNGEVVWVLGQSAVELDKEGKVVGHVGTLTNISQQKQAEAASRQSERLHHTLIENVPNEAVALFDQELSELKSRFVAMTSHEFRTPLSTILSASELLEYYSHRWTEAEKLEQLHLIQASVHHMTQLLEDVLLIGKAEAGQLQSEPKVMDLSNLCASLITEIQFGLGSQHTLVFSCPPSGLDVVVDAKLLRQVLSNLLSNAIKYSNPGSQIFCRLVADSTDAIVQIQDEGIGISPTDLSRIFNSFYRAKNVGATPGTGLGLAIVKRCLDLLGGEISVHSELGIGTTFTVRLPLAQ